MFEKLIFHTLKGISGWSSCTHVKLDINKIISFKYHERMFKIFDTSHDYTLIIKYDESNTHTTFSPVIGGKGGVVMNTVTETNRTITITKRYETLKDITKEINEIKQKQNMLNKYIKKTKNNLSKEITKNIDDNTLKSKGRKKKIFIKKYLFKNN